MLLALPEVVMSWFSYVWREDAVIVLIGKRWLGVGGSDQRWLPYHIRSWSKMAVRCVGVVPRWSLLRFLENTL